MIDIENIMPLNYDKIAKIIEEYMQLREDYDIAMNCIKGNCLYCTYFNREQRRDPCLTCFVYGRAINWELDKERFSREEIGK